MMRSTVEMSTFHCGIWLFVCSLIGFSSCYEKSFSERRFTARYDTCNDRGTFVLDLANDDGDCQVLCGPSGSPKLYRLKDRSVCTTSDKNEPGSCVMGVCTPSPVLAERERVTTTRRPTRPPRTTVKFVRSTLPPITSGFTYSWQKWATYKPSTAATESSTKSPLTTPSSVGQRGRDGKRIDP